MGMSRGSTAAINQREQVKRRRKAMFRIKPSVIAVYASVFALIVVMISIGYHVPQESSVVANAININPVSQTSVDSVIATGIASSVAQSANLSIAPNIANLAISTQTKNEFEQLNGTNTTKPQIIGSSVASRSIVSYAVKSEDTIESLSAKFNISKDTIKWANNLTYDTLYEGTVLQILPVNGTIYDVKFGDTIDSVAAKYSVDKTRLVLYNDLDISGLVPDSKIILPDAVLPANERPGYIAPVVYYYTGLGSGFGGRTWNIEYNYGRARSSGNTYVYGNCTFYAYDRRMQLGLPVSASWGHAYTWAANARQSGLTVDNTPSIGAVIQNGGNLGHVAIVENILSNGDLSISEMNASVAGGGYNTVSGRVILSGNVSQYLYIH